MQGLKYVGLGVYTFLRNHPFVCTAILLDDLSGSCVVVLCFSDDKDDISIRSLESDMWKKVSIVKYCVKGWNLLQTFVIHNCIV